MRWKNSQLLYFTIIIGSLGCLEQIDLAKNITGREDIVIDAALFYGDSSIGDTSLVRVAVSRLFNFQINQSEPLALEWVRLISGGEFVELERESVGIFRKKLNHDGSEKFNLKLGKYYSIDIRAQNGLHIYSDSMQLLHTPKMEISPEITSKTIKNLIGNFEDIPLITINAKIPIREELDGALSRMRFRFERAYRLTDNTEQICYITSFIDVPELALFNGNILERSTIVNLPISVQLLDHHFAEGYYINVFQESLTETAFEYWQNVQSLLIRTGNMFESPVGQIRGNFYDSSGEEQIIGYFYATSVRLYRLYISPQFAGNPMRLCPIPDNYQPCICLDCLCEPGSSLIKPVYWIE